MNLKTSQELMGQRLLGRPGVEIRSSFTPGQSPALVFLQGGLGSRLNWRSQFAALSNSNLYRSSRGQAITPALMVIAEYPDLINQAIAQFMNTI
ncbi:hypothetical protein [Lyngbya confervoides]|uniref:Alpha/beta hydrolase n=1 Tax=Lyngbya confervoides BDU141951 TaxID=1574623 RepID=A0ABD4T867_9CYAN|nr:hypothetical protein [Lyngbya confervoides]MCM1984475.1 hypothetical protein [Lyngbya confervoides BDU141951]